MCTFTGTRLGRRQDRVFSNTLRCSIIGYAGIRHWGIVPRYVLSRRPRWPNLTQCPLNRGKIIVKFRQFEDTSHEFQSYLAAFITGIRILKKDPDMDAPARAGALKTGF